MQGFGNVRAFLMKKVCFFAAALLGSVLFLTVYQNAERSQILTQIKIPSYQLMMMPERAREQVKRQYQELAAQMATEGLKMDQEAVFNVAKAGENRYTFGNGSAAAARNTGGVIEGNDLTVYTSLSSKFKFNATSSAKRYTIKAVKAGE